MCLGFPTSSRGGRAPAPSAYSRNTSPCFPQCYLESNRWLARLANQLTALPRATAQAAFRSYDSYFHVHELHEVHDFFVSVSLTPFVSAEAGLEGLDSCIGE